MAIAPPAGPDGGAATRGAGQTTTINGATMISENCSINEFVESVKGKETWEVLTLAVEEATRADRMVFRTRRYPGEGTACDQAYSRHLKRLINYLRFTVKPRRPDDVAYCLYVSHWGSADKEDPTLLPDHDQATRH
jgi:hypothetical protein